MRRQGTQPFTRKTLKATFHDKGNQVASGEHEGGSPGEGLHSVIEFDGSLRRNLQKI